MLCCRCFFPIRKAVSPANTGLINGTIPKMTAILPRGAETFCYSFVLISKLFQIHNVGKTNNNKTTKPQNRRENPAFTGKKGLRIVFSHSKKIETLKFTSLLAAIGMVGMASAPAKAADDCIARGDLDQIYCDMNGDLVADAPAEDQLVDPDTLVFAYTPVEDPAVYADIWDPFLKHLEEVTGKDVHFFAVQSNSAEVEAMRSGRLHVAGFSTGPTPFAVNLAGAVPFALMGGDDGRFGYTLQLYTRTDSGINTVADLKGKRVAHTSPTSNSGNLAPRALLPGQGVVPDEDYEVVYSGSHDQSILGVVAGDYDAAPVASEVVDRMAQRDLYDPSEVKVIYESKPFPTTSFNYAYNLKPELVEKIKEAFFTFDMKGTALGEEFKGVSKFIPVTYQDDWAVIREIQAANGVKYTPDNLK